MQLIDVISAFINNKRLGKNERGAFDKAIEGAKSLGYPDKQAARDFAERQMRIWNNQADDLQGNIDFFGSHMNKKTLQATTKDVKEARQKAARASQAVQWIKKGLLLTVLILGAVSAIKLFGGQQLQSSQK